MGFKLIQVRDAVYEELKKLRDEKLLGSFSDAIAMLLELHARAKQNKEEAQK